MSDPVRTVRNQTFTRVLKECAAVQWQRNSCLVFRVAVLSSESNLPRSSNVTRHHNSAYFQKASILAHSSADTRD